MSTRLRGVTSMASRAVMSELAHAAGDAVDIEAAGGVDVQRRIERGEAFDFVVLARDAVDKLAAAGRLDVNSRIDLARSSIALAVRSGAATPTVTSEQTVKHAVMLANKVGYSTGPSGEHLRRVFERWGVDPAFTVQAPPGVPVARLIAHGEVDLGFQQLSELMNMPGVEVAGVLPEPLQKVTVFTGAVCVAATERDASRRFLAFCASPQADAVKRRHHMEPAHA